MSNDPNNIDELRERARWFEDRGWSTQAEDVRADIEELTKKAQMDADERVKAKLRKKRQQETHGGEIAELKEKLCWYEQHGWTSSADRIREELAELSQE